MFSANRRDHTNLREMRGRTTNREDDGRRGGGGNQSRITAASVFKQCCVVNTAKYKHNTIIIL